MNPVNHTYPILTVILAVKDSVEAQLNSCVWAIASLRNSAFIELLIVSSGAVARPDERCRKIFYGVKVVDAEPLGVYSAYNRGLEEKLGEYVLFMGVDDLVLPGLDRVIDSLLDADYRPDLVACYAYMQDVGLSGPSKIRGSLIFRNWCHQGLLYNSRLFTKRRFDIKYRVQADHKLNLELIADRSLRVAYRKDLIAHFASGGLTSKFPDLLFRADMPGIVLNSYGFFYWIIALAKRKLADWIKGPPETRGTPKQ